MFGGNEGIKNITNIRAAGIITHVILEESIEEIEAEILHKYPGTKCEFFKKDNKFTGTIKISFKDEKTLQDAIENRIKIFNQVYIMELFKMKPRVIKCYYCQKFGHIGRVCRANSPKCGKCGQSHETKSCNVLQESYKCCHCEGNHITGDPECEVIKSKLEEIANRRQDV